MVLQALGLAFVLAGLLARAASPSGTVTCGSHQYSPDAVEAAVNAGVEDMDNGDFPDNYPHQFRE